MRRRPVGEVEEWRRRGGTEEAIAEPRVGGASLWPVELVPRRRAVLTAGGGSSTRPSTAGGRRPPHPPHPRVIRFTYPEEQLLTLGPADSCRLCSLRTEAREVQEVSHLHLHLPRRWPGVLGAPG